MARDNYFAPANDPQAIATGGPHVVAVTESGVFIVTIGGILPYPANSSGKTQIGAPNSVAFQDGYFFFLYDDGTLRATGTNTNSQTSNTLDFNDQGYTKCQSASGTWRRVTAAADQIWCFGDSTIEVYSDQALSPFPYSRAQVIPIGLYGRWCIAGWESGWSGSQIFVASDGTVRLMNGYTPQPISTRPVERAIAAAAGPSVLRASVYTHGGQAIWSLSGPGFTWEYNVTSQQWHERASQGLSRWRAETSVRAFGKWMLGDIVDGSVLALNPDARTENGAPVVARIESAPLRNFPDRMRLGGLTLDITTGQGLPTAPDASCLINWTVNGGGSWAQALQRKIGGPGLYGVPVRVGDLGRSGRDGVQIGVTVSDPVMFSLRSAALPSIVTRKGS
ncbi:hypothetical protein MKK88_05800 [Methylobacterium sp. E-005]|uniref:hypothetical protein n=1 Tax=Methylobacterium sp. E-005 TaxID=2836549 RepID=UPI001FBAE513|nr:hypothetical protein [Methylobacterium sp. E-005]MCJ2085508.1 hypothetical protein [Methylobacterium sp. E-005]